MESTEVITLEQFYYRCNKRRRSKKEAQVFQQMGCPVCGLFIYFTMVNRILRADGLSYVLITVLFAYRLYFAGTHQMDWS
ncbi:hypothetical protein D3C85_1103740 [compost metagenome]